MGGAKDYRQMEYMKWSVMNSELRHYTSGHIWWELGRRITIGKTLLKSGLMLAQTGSPKRISHIPSRSIWSLWRVDACSNSCVLTHNIMIVHSLQQHCIHQYYGGNNCNLNFGLQWFVCAHIDCNQHWCYQYEHQGSSQNPVPADQGDWGRTCIVSK